MPERKKKVRSDATPVAGLGEARLHRVLGYQVAQAGVVTIALFEQLVGLPLDLRPAEFTALTLINENPRVAPAQLSAALAVSRPYITNTIAKLEARGLVTRDRSDSDRRSQHLATTDRGRELASRATSLLIEGERKALASLSAGEQMILAELLHKVACRREAVPGAGAVAQPQEEEEPAPARRRARAR